MTKFHAGGLNAESVQCFVCEKAVIGGDWFARVKHGEQTIVLCSQQCANAFYAKRLPSLRQIGLLAALQSLQWPRQQAALLNEI